MNTNMSAAELRRWAAQCDARLKDPLATGEELDLLVKMRDGLFAVAETQEWLEGKTSNKPFQTAG